jgi:hypothetical protein
MYSMEEELFGYHYTHYNKNKKLTKKPSSIVTQQHSVQV